MTGYAGDIATLRVDLNRLRGDSIATRRDFVEGGDAMLPHLNQGDAVRIVEEEGDTYLAAVERVDGLLVYLRVDLDSWTPNLENVGDRSPYAPEFRPEVNDPDTIPATMTPA